MSIELRHLRYFVAVAEDLHFGRAAERLGISQPPLSQQILALERTLGARLFERTTRRVGLTEAGRLFFAEAKEVLAKVEHAAAMAERVHRGEAGELRVGFFGSAPFVTDFQRLVYGFRSSHPDVHLDLQEMPTFQQVDALLEGRLDVGFVRPLGPTPEALVLTELCREPLMAVMRPDHPLASTSGALPISALAGEPFVLYARGIGTGLYQQVIDLCRNAGFAPQVRQEANATPTMMGLVAAGLGVSILPASLERLKFDGARFRPLADEGAVTGVCLARRYDDRSALVRAMFNAAARMKQESGGETNGRAKG